nr:NAD(P)-binding domain-containing protein [Micromonospora sp. DSM 115978]
MYAPESLPVAVIGAGPVGLAAAAHLAVRRIPFRVLESGALPASAVRAWSHVQLFSPWRYNIDHAAREILDAAGWATPDPEAAPTGSDLVHNYLEPLAGSPALAPHLTYNATVTAISRLGTDRLRTAGREHAPFLLRLTDDTELTARAVIDASGTWHNPNTIGANGLPAIGEHAASALIDYAIPDVLGADRDRYAARHTVVVGAGHSAATVLLALAELVDQVPETTVTWVIRASSPDRAYGGEDADALPARGALGTGLRMLTETGRVRLITSFPVAAVETDGATITLVSRGSTDERRRVTADRVIAVTGFRPDHRIADELRLGLDPILGTTALLAPLIDPNQHSCGTVRPHGVDELVHPEPGYYAVGMKSYGRASTFLMATGHEQVRSVVAALAGDWAAAREVRLELPETGVCSATIAAKALTERLGLPPDVPARLLAAASRHLDTSATASDAVLAAAADLGIDRPVALQLAAFAADALGQPTTPAESVAALR